jgi:hypothetical protein
LICGLVEAVPDIETQMGPGYLQWEEWSGIDAMQFMQELLLVCDRLTTEPANSPLLSKVFEYLEMWAVQLDLPATAQALPAVDRAACDFLLFTFTDNPTGKDSKLKRLSTYMGPKIEKMCTILN